MSMRAERIFIRAQDSKGKWSTISLAKATDEQLGAWLGRYIIKGMQDPHKEIPLLLDAIGIPAVELKEGMEL